MQELLIPFCNDLSSAGKAHTVAGYLRRLDKHSISNAPWQAGYPYKPNVRFSIAYGSDCFFLQFNVREKEIRAVHTKTNEPVYQDSCVEFFVSFDDGDSYYNFEFNCIGTVLAGFGKTKTDRELLAETSLAGITTGSVIDRQSDGATISWELTIMLPFRVFSFHQLQPQSGQSCRANFYKCGDDLPEPHFLSWSDIESSEPNFHLPEFFGTLRFQ